MFTAFERVVPLLLLGQIQPSMTPAQYGVGLATLALGACVVWLLVRQRSLKARLAGLERETRETREGLRALGDKERKQAKTLDERRQEIDELKRDLTTQRKKTFEGQEENKKLRAEMKSLAEDKERREKSRPAFADGQARSPESTPPVAAKIKETKEDKDAKPHREPAPPRETRPEPPPVDPAASEQLVRLKEENQRLADVLSIERAELRELRDEAKAIRHRVESLRRIDLISKGQIAVLEDKLKTMGRYYYDAVSELAQLKGEVAPPVPHEFVAPNDDSAPLDSVAAEPAGGDEPLDDANETPYA